MGANGYELAESGGAMALDAGPDCRDVAAADTTLWRPGTWEHRDDTTILIARSASGVT